MVFQKGRQTRHLEEIPHQRKATKHVRRVQNEAAQVTRNSSHADPGRAPGHFPSQLGFPSYIFSCLGPYEVAKAMNHALESKQLMKGLV